MSLSSSNRKKIFLLCFSLFIHCILTGQDTPVDLPWSAEGCELLIPGIAAITCGVLTDQASADKYTFALLDLNKALPSFGRVDVTIDQDVYHHPSWHIDSIGLVYGVEIHPSGDVLLTASSNYGSGFAGQAADLAYGSIGGGTNDLNAAGTIYNIDGTTGQATVFSVLPQQTTDIEHHDCQVQTSFIRNTGVGLGNIAYDPINHQYFVSNIEDGRIYRLDLDGNILDSYDPGIYDDGAAGISNLEDLAYGLAVEPESGRLFYGGIYSDVNVFKELSIGSPRIYSIDLDSNGGFVGSVNNTTMPSGATYDNYVGTETLHATLTAGGDQSMANAQYFISDLEFTPSGQLLAGVRVGCESSFHTSYNHWGETNILTLNSTNNLFDSSADYDISVTESMGQNDNYGGVAYYELEDGSVQYAVSSADILEQAGPHGIAIFQSTASTTNEVNPLGAISYGPSDSNDPKGIGGEIDVFNECPYVDLSLDKSVNTNIANMGDSVVFTLVVTNEGTGIANNVEVGDLLPIGLSYISDNSGGNYNETTGIWSIASILDGDSISIAITASIEAEGILTNSTEIIRLDEPDVDSTPDNDDLFEDDYSEVCLSIPIQVCQEDTFAFKLSGENGLGNYQWYNNDVLINNETSSSYMATEEGVYTYTVDGAGPTGNCEGELCCPVIIEAIECCTPIDCIPVKLLKLKGQN